MPHRRARGATATAGVDSGQAARQGRVIPDAGSGADGIGSADEIGGTDEISRVDGISRVEPEPDAQDARAAPAGVRHQDRQVGGRRRRHGLPRPRRRGTGDEGEHVSAGDPGVSTAFSSSAQASQLGIARTSTHSASSANAVLNAPTSSQPCAA
ncbi:hypothetical protein [Parafrankia discariae]|uniref:hypothetical protein n=1 Tax=Parafrankia discariae TaxID=365528 RepID=UPI000369091C|nr:hypothetical protein [Parafrankia discariae]